MARKFNNPIDSKPKALGLGLAAGALLVGVAWGTHGSGPNSIASGIATQATQVGEGHQANLVSLYPITVHRRIGRAALLADILQAVSAADVPTIVTLAEATCDDDSASGAKLGISTENDLLGVTNTHTSIGLQEADAFAAQSACFEGLDERLATYDEAQVATGHPVIPTVAATQGPVHT